MAAPEGGHFVSIIVMRFAFVLGRPGSDLLFQALRLSTIGAGEFNGRVRNGIGYRLPADTTRPAKDEWKTSKRKRVYARLPLASEASVPDLDPGISIHKLVLVFLSHVARCALKMRDDQAHTSD
jgi:hypothetical protein